MRLYDTKMAAPFKARAQEALKIVEGLGDAKELLPVLIDSKVRGLSNLADESIPNWSHPIYSHRLGASIIDTRTYLNRNNEVKDKNAHNAFVLRAKLETVWEQEPESFEFILSDVSAVFATWIGNGLRQRFSVNELDVFRAKIVSVLYYFKLMTPYETRRRMRGDQLVSNIMKICTRTLRIPTAIVEQVLEIEEVRAYADSSDNDVEFFVGLLNIVCDTPLGDLNFFSFSQSIISGAWMGLNDRQLPGILFEHPPTLVWMMERHQNIGIYKKTGIGIAIDSIKRNIDLERVTLFVTRS